MATLPNAVNPSAIVTRLRKRRDLETTMNTLKQLLEPSIKKGSRKKNKPRSIAKKVTPKKTIKRFDYCSEEDGEYYPNKLKRKVRLKKTVLKSRHELKVVVATNKRKRGTPHKGLDAILEESEPNKNQDISSSIPDTDHQKPKKSNSSSTSLQVLTTPSSNSDVYELMSPPHKSLTRLTVDDLIRMDEDSLSDEDLMEILTCPSPVWWEDPTDDDRGSLFLTKTSDIPEPTNTTDKDKKTTEVKTYSNKKGIGTKKTGVVNVTAGKARKIAKLENILGHIKSLMCKNVTVVNKKPESHDGIQDVDNNREMKENISDKTKEIANDLADNITVRRTISSSGSEISVNEDDLLRNLENIDIPIQDQLLQNTENLSDLQNDIDDKDDKEDSGVVLKDKNVTKMYPNSDEDESPDNEGVEATEESIEQNEKETNDPIFKKSTGAVFDHVDKICHETRGTNTDFDANMEDANIAKEKNDENAAVFNKTSILTKLKNVNDDILDVRLIQIPTNVTNEIQIWSKLDNFKRHNFKAADFSNEVIDVEDELEFAMIQNSSLKFPMLENSPTKDLVDTNEEPILIDDDSNDALDVNRPIFNDAENSKIIDKTNDVTLTTVNDDANDARDVNRTIFNDMNLNVIDKCNDVTLTTVTDELSQNSDVTEFNDPKEAMGAAIIKEDTIRISKDLDVRLIETSVQSSKPKLKPKKIVKIGPYKKYENKNKSTEKEVQREQKSPIKAKTKWHSKSKFLLSYSKEANESGNFRVLDTKDTSDTILRLNNDVDVSLVKNPGARKDNTPTKNEHTKNNDLSITLVNKNVTDVTITPMALPKLTKNPGTTYDSPKSVKSLTSEGTLESEGTISDSNIQFLDEYEFSQKTDHENTVNTDQNDNDSMDENALVIDEDKMPDLDDGDDIQAQAHEHNLSGESKNLNESQDSVDFGDEEVEVNCNDIIINLNENDSQDCVDSEGNDFGYNVDKTNQELVTIYRIVSNKENADKVGVDDDITDAEDCEEVNNTRGSIEDNGDMAPQTN